MAIIDVECSDVESGWTCHVSILEGGSKTKHKVHIKAKDYDNLTDDKTSVDDLVKKSFEFLLERESKEQILSEFNLMDIAKYFDDFESVIKS